MVVYMCAYTVRVQLVASALVHVFVFVGFCSCLYVCVSTGAVSVSEWLVMLLLTWL